MNSISLNEVYAELIYFVKMLPESIVDLSDIQEESVNADAELEQDIVLLSQAVDKLKNAREASDMQLQRKALIHVRVHAMNVSTVFSNLAECVASLAVSIGPLFDE